MESFTPLVCSCGVFGKRGHQHDMVLAAGLLYRFEFLAGAWPSGSLIDARRTTCRAKRPAQDVMPSECDVRRAGKCMRWLPGLDFTPGGIAGFIKVIVERFDTALH
jgi:hypothetical protein